MLLSARIVIEPVLTCNDRTPPPPPLPPAYVSPIDRASISSTVLTTLLEDVQADRGARVRLRPQGA